MLICCVVIGSLAPAASPVMVARRPLAHQRQVMHFCAYMALSLLPVIGFKDRRAGLKAGLSMFLLGVLTEAGQHFSPGRAVEQRLWEIRVDSVLKLDRAAKRVSTDENHRRCPAMDSPPPLVAHKRTLVWRAPIEVLALRQQLAVLQPVNSPGTEVAAGFNEIRKTAPETT